MGRKFAFIIAAMIISLLLTFIFLEIFARLFLIAPPSVTVNNLINRSILNSMPIKSEAVQNGKVISKEDFRENLYLRTPTGDRLKGSVVGIVKNHALTNMEVEIRTNSLGFRYPELGEKKKEDYRILALGDSITLCDYCDEKDSYPFFLENYLRKMDVPSFKKKIFQVINGGVAGIDIQNEFAILVEAGLASKPDMVLVEIYLNDAYESPSLLVTRLPPLFEQSRFLRILFYHLSLLNTHYRFQSLQGNVEKILLAEARQFALSHKVTPTDGPHGFDTEEEFNSLIFKNFNDWGYAWSEDYLKRILDIVKLMRQTSQDYHFKLVTVFFPVSYQVQSKILKNEPQSKLSQAMTRLQIPHLDLLPFLREKYQRDGINVFFDHCHYKSEGNDFVAKTIADFLTARVIDQ